MSVTKKLFSDSRLDFGSGVLFRTQGLSCRLVHGTSAEKLYRAVLLTWNPPILSFTLEQQSRP